MSDDPRALPLKGLGLPGGPSLLRGLSRLGVTTVADLLLYLPRRYEDRRAITPIGELVADAPATIRARVADLRVEQTWRRGVQRTIATLVDESGAIDAVWYGRRFIERRLAPGGEVVASGRVKARGWTLTMEAPEFSAADADEAVGAGKIVPIYRLTAGVTATSLRRAIRALLDRFGPGLVDPLPVAVREAQGLLPLAEAIEHAHWPEAFERRDAALRRLAFDELLAVQVSLVRRRRRSATGEAVAISVEQPERRRIEQGIRAGLAPDGRAESAPWTVDQAAAIEAILADLSRRHPMLRLLQGDVGTGKTAIAFVAAAVAATAGVQSALLAPTELLARQHAAAASRILGPLGIPSVLLVGGTTPAERRTGREAAASGDARLVIGTHALLAEATAFARLGLVIVDEQHRFGVEERARLLAKGSGEPHLLLMTATPIPRTIAQLLYADVASSELHGLPAGRRPIRTAIRASAELGRVWEFVAAEAAAGRRSFVVVPRIGADDPGVEPGWLDAPGLDAAAAAGIEAEAERIRAAIPSVRVGVVHGAQRPAERAATMAAFAEGAIDVLVGTTVVEVGVDIPAASVMVVLQADRFGLATLHQLRGRVGRGRFDGYCVLVSDSEDAVAHARLAAVESTRDGFVLAERDMELRGEGSVLGTEQSGLPPLRIASLARPDDRALAAAARTVAEALLAPDGSPLEAARDLLDAYASGWPVGRALGGAPETASAA
ncbi:MAG: hypothetical protein RLZZ432_349 [Chloroflexota bacterium]